MPKEFQDILLYVPQNVTNAGATYLKVHFEIVAFLRFIEGIADELDALNLKMTPFMITYIRGLEDALGVSHERSDSAVKDWEEFVKDPSPYKKEKELFDPFLTSTTFTKVVDNFLSYLADVIAEVFTVRPELLRSNETKRVDWILSFNNFDELVSAIAEDKVLALSHSSIKDLDRYMSEKMGLSLLGDEGLLEHLTMLNELRNLIVHNRGIVNSLSKRKSKLITDEAGTQIVLNWHDVGYALEFLGACLNHVDISIVDKFHLPTPFVGDDLVQQYGRGGFAKTTPIDEGEAARPEGSNAGPLP